MSQELSISAGRDYNARLHGVYEFVVFAGEQMIHRQTGFKSKKTAVNAALRHIEEVEKENA